MIRQTIDHLEKIRLNIETFENTRGQAYNGKQLRENQRLNFERFLQMSKSFRQSLVFLIHFNGCLIASLDTIRMIDGNISSVITK